MTIENTSLLNWYQQQQTPAGWFDLLTLMIDGMVDNAGEEQSRPFLVQMGQGLAQRYPLPLADTLGDLEIALNQQLTTFGWGYITLSLINNSIMLHHHALPVCQIADQQERWCRAFATILEGAYGCWIKQQGGEDNVTISVERFISLSEIQFRYQNT